MRSSSPVTLGLLVAAVGVALVLVAAGVVPSDPDSFSAPRWLLGLCGGVTIAGGLAAMSPPSVRGLLGFLIALGLGVGAAWVALFGEAAGFSGEIPFLPAWASVALARGFFGLGALVAFALVAWGLRQLLRGESLASLTTDGRAQAARGRRRETPEEPEIR